MRKGLHNKVLASLLSFAVVVSGSGIYSMTNGTNASAADDTATALTKVLGAEDIDLRAQWNDKSNVGEEHTVELSNGSTITVKDNGTMRTELTAQQLADTEMGMGINLGNTLEAVYLVEQKNSVSGSGFDKAWSQPETTQKFIDCLHSYGINTLRIPVAWSNGDIDDGTYTIRGALLDRVEEVVNYALNNGMYVIINDHWDNQWWGQFGACTLDENGDKQADEATRAEAWKRYERYWTQISERFKGYSDHLIFEGANEELGERLNDGICINGPAKGYAKPDNAGTDVKAVSGNLTTDQLYETTNKINQKFVEVVRATGENNETRHLLIPGYNTDILSTADTRYEMPKDTVESNGVSKLFLSVHYYTPSDFCLDNATGTYTTKDQEATKTYFKSLKKFSDAGYGIIIGECGVVNPSGVTGSVTQWFYDTFTEAAKYHAVPVLWDTGAYFDRKEAKINYKDIAVFYNTVNGTTGSTDADLVTGGEPSASTGDVVIPDYLDSTLWKTPGLHGYIFYQTASWDYRDSYSPARNLSPGKHSWEYIVASGSEVSASTTKVTDVLIKQEGEYTLAIDGIDLSGANYFKMLGVSTDIEKSLYPGVTATDCTIKIDGKEVTDAPFDLVVKADNKYYTFMLINKYDSSQPVENYGLGTLNENEKLKMPTKSIEITVKFNGLKKVFEDIANGNYVNPETGTKIPGTNKQNNSTTNKPATGLKKGAAFTSGKYKYKVTKAASGSKKGTVTMTGLAKKGKSAKKLSLATTVKDKYGKSYSVTAIGKKAFSGAKATSITLNKKIKKIPSSAFAKCKKLKTLTLKAKLSSVSKNAFKGCKKKITVKGTAKKANKKKLKKTSYKKFK